MTKTERPLLFRISVVCVALLCTVPFLHPLHRYPLTTFYAEWLSFVLGIGVMIVLLDRSTWDRAEVPWVALSPFALAALLIGHGILGWSPYFGHALLGALYLVWAGGLIVAVRALVKAYGVDTVLTVVAAGLAVGALLSALIGLIQYFSLMTPFNLFIAQPTTAAIYGNLGQTNHFGTYTTLGLLSLVYLHSRGRLPIIATVFWAMPMLFVLGLSGSRSVWLYLFVALGLAAWRRLKSPQDDGGRIVFIACGALIIIHYLMQLAVGAGWLTPPDRAAVTAVERLFSGVQSVTDRIGLWGAAWSIAMEHPVFGIGWGAFASRYFDFISTEGSVAPLGIFNNAHNVLLQFFVETGIIGVTLLVTPLVFFLVRLLQCARDTRQWWLLGTIGVLAIHSMLEYPLWYAYFLGIAALLLGVAPVSGFVPQLAKLGRIFAAAMISIAVINLTFIWLDYREFEGLFRPTPEQLRAKDVPAIMRRLHGNALLTPYVELSIVQPLEVAEENLSNRLAINGSVMRFMPEPLLVYRQVLLLALAERQQEAQVLLARARRAYPAGSASFDQELARLAELHPERFRPLLESVSRRAGARN